MRSKEIASIFSLESQRKPLRAATIEARTNLSIILLHLCCLVARELPSLPRILCRLLPFPKSFSNMASDRPHSAVPVQCPGGCGFYGNPSFLGYCSVCYKKQQGSTPVLGPGASAWLGSNFLWLALEHLLRCRYW
jgi:hypothetical protein